MQTTGGTSPQRMHCRVIKLVMVSSGCGPTRRGSCIVREQHVWQRSHGRSKNCRCCPKTLRKACEGLLGRVCEEQSNAVLESMQHELEEYVLLEAYASSEHAGGPQRSHQMGWAQPGMCREKFASECTSSMAMRYDVTFAWVNVRHSVVHRRNHGK